MSLTANAAIRALDLANMFESMTADSPGSSQSEGKPSLSSPAFRAAAPVLSVIPLSAADLELECFRLQAASQLECTRSFHGDLARFAATTAEDRSTLKSMPRRRTTISDWSISSRSVALHGAAEICSCRTCAICYGAHRTTSRRTFLPAGSRHFVGIVTVGGHI